MSSPQPEHLSADADAAEREEDVQLVAAVARGDREAYGALYDRYAGRMMALGVRVFGARREAEDVLHDVFVEVWKHAGDFDPRRGAVKTWLFLRMRSRCLDRVRSAGYSRGQSLDARPELAETGASDAESVESAPDRRRVRSVLAALPEEQRVVIELGYFKGWSSSEIAEHLGIPTGTVKSRTRVALMRLRESLGVRR